MSEYFIYLEVLPKVTDFSSDDEESIQSSKTGNLRRVTYRKTREELNEIEKQRTRRINEQIISIRGLLDVSNVPTRKDKYSVLCSAYEFILNLKKTVEEYRLRLVGNMLPSMNSKYSNFDLERIVNQKVMAAGDYQNDGLLRNGFDHLLKYSRSPMALMTIDAKFISCNESFCSFTGFSSDELLVMSLFNLSSADNLKSLFKSVGTLIDQSGNNAHHIWNQFQFKYKECLCFTSLWIVGDNGGGPAFIQMMLVSVEDSVSGVGLNHSQTNPNLRTVTSSSPVMPSSQEPTYAGGNIRENLPPAVDLVQDDLWTHKQKCVALLRQKFAEQQATNPNSSILPLLKIKQEYEKIQQQQRQHRQQLQLADGAAMASLLPLPLSRTPSSSSSSTSSSSWLHPSQGQMIQSQSQGQMIQGQSQGQMIQGQGQGQAQSPLSYQLPPKYTVKLNHKNNYQQQQQLVHCHQSQYKSQNDDDDMNRDMNQNTDHPLFASPPPSPLPLYHKHKHNNLDGNLNKGSRSNGDIDALTCGNGYGNDGVDNDIPL